MMFPRSSQHCVLFAASLFMSGSLANAQYLIDLSLVGPTGNVIVGQTIDVKLRATRVAKQSFIGSSFIGIDCILDWNPKHFTLMGLANAGSVPLMASYFPSPASDYTGINELAIPRDGDALYYAIAGFGSPVQVPTTGVQVTTFRMKVISPFTSSAINILPTLTVDAPADTIVYDGTVPGLDVVGALHSAIINQIPPCPSDLNGDGQVAGNDLALLLDNWNDSGVGDLDASGFVDGDDLAVLLDSWGACGGT